MSSFLSRKLVFCDARVEIQNIPKFIDTSNNFFAQNLVAAVVPMRIDIRSYFIYVMVYSVTVLPEAALCNLHIYSRVITLLDFNSN